MKTRQSFDAIEHAMRAKAAPLDGLFAVDPQPSIKEKLFDSPARRVLDAFESRRPTNASLAYVRGKLVELYNERVRTLPPESWWVSADHADDILQAWSEFPSGGNQSWRGSIFRSGWERTGQYIKSSRPHMNGTDMPCWRPRGAA